MGIQITVRDGRSGRDRALDTEEGGVVLMQFEGPRFLDEGERLTLPDGSEVEIIGGNEHMGGEDWRQTVFVGNVWNTPDAPPIT